MKTFYSNRVLVFYWNKDQGIKILCVGQSNVAKKENLYFLLFYFLFKSNLTEATVLSGYTKNASESKCFIICLHPAYCAEFLWPMDCFIFILESL